MDMLISCNQVNGERLPVEEWVYTGVINRTILDPKLVMIVKNAIEIRPFGWPRKESNIVEDLCIQVK